MGRLMLNVLLSFAQFERELTGERVRDELAASKKRGIWMGRPVPFGYDVRNRALSINPDEADTVRLIFSRYLELGNASFNRTWSSAASAPVRSPAAPAGPAATARSAAGTSTGCSRPLSTSVRSGTRPSVTRALHDAIIDTDLWAKVQTALSDNT